MIDTLSWCIVRVFGLVLMCYGNFLMLLVRPKMHQDFELWNEISSIEMVGAMMFESKSVEALPPVIGKQFMFFGKLTLGLVGFIVLSSILDVVKHGLAS